MQLMRPTVDKALSEHLLFSGPGAKSGKNAAGPRTVSQVLDTAQYEKTTFRWSLEGSKGDRWCYSIPSFADGSIMARVGLANLVFLTYINVFSARLKNPGSTSLITPFSRRPLAANL